MSTQERTPHVSVIVPTFRRPDMLRRAIDTVQRQTFADWELIVVDDNGADHPDQQATSAVVGALTDPRIRYVVRERNGGGGAARNSGIQEARAPLVAFLDDDDAWYPDKLARQVEVFERSAPDVALVFGGFRNVSVVTGERMVLPRHGRYEMTHLLRSNPIGTTSLVMCRRDALLAVDGFDDQLPSMQDIDLYVRLARRYAFDFVPEALLDKHQHERHAIGKDLKGVVVAHERFHTKHRDAFTADRDAHAAFLERFGLEALRAGEIALGRRHLWHAWRLRPLVVTRLLLALSANAHVISLYRWARTLTRGAARDEATRT